MSSETVRQKEPVILWSLEFGARPQTDGSTQFRIYAPRVKNLSVKIVGGNERSIPMMRDDEDVFEARIESIGVGADYLYVIDGEKERPDPVSRWQPAGVHGPSRVVDPQGFAWTDSDWQGIPLKDYLIYELHTGTFTPEGTFEAIIPKLSYLKSLGITAIEIMPVAEFPGGRNWGYDGTYLYAPQSTYGGPEGLKKLIDASHRAGLAVVMDVVYNHLGPEGNYLGEYLPFASETYRTPWGEAINFDGSYSDGVRRFFIENALYWLTEYHVDALRLDAVHRIIDNSPRHFLEELASEFHAQATRLNRQAFIIAESDLNDVRLLKPTSTGGYGLDAQWSDDFHHSLHALLTKTTRGYFADFGRVSDLAKAITEGFVYDHRHSAFRKKIHGTSSASQPGEQFVICIQNHDQIANSYWGDRLSTLLPLSGQKLAAALLLTAPNLPMLFMGQEWGESAPFLYFTSHTDPALAEAVRVGRKEEYSSFVKEEEGGAALETHEFDDPQSPATFEKSKLRWQSIEDAPHAELLNFYRDLIEIRKRNAAVSNCDKELTRVVFDEAHEWIIIERGDESGKRAMLVCNLGQAPFEIPLPLRENERWKLILWTEDKKYGGDTEAAQPPQKLTDGDALVTIRLAQTSAALYISE